MEEFTSFIWAFSEFFIKLIINEVLIQIKNVVKNLFEVDFCNNITINCSFLKILNMKVACKIIWL